MPAIHRTNLQQGAPFRRRGRPAALGAQGMADVGAVLRALTAGFTPGQPAM